LIRRITAVDLPSARTEREYTFGIVTAGHALSTFWSSEAIARCAHLGRRVAAGCRRCSNSGPRGTPGFCGRIREGSSVERTDILVDLVLIVYVTF
jgi:hypothetical protein